MTTIDLDKEFSVGPSPRLEDLKALRMRGFAAVVDLRIPGELGALSVEHEKEAVESLGMTSLHLAVPARTLPSTLLDQFRREVGLLPKPAYVHCTKGRRAALFTITDPCASVRSPVMRASSSLLIVPFDKSPWARS